MDFNSNDEYLKVFPPNFGPKLEGCNMLNQLIVSDFQVHKVLPKNQQDNIEETYMKQIPEPTYLDEELECVEVQEPIQVHTPMYNAKNKGDEMLKAPEFLTFCKEDFALARDKLNLAQDLSQIIEPMPQVVDMTPVMEVQRDNEMVLGDSAGEPREPSVETPLSLQDINETRVFDGETLISDTRVEGPPSTIEIMQETTINCEIPAEDAITIGVIEDSILAFDNIGHDEAEKSILKEAIEVPTMKDETSVGLPPLREFVEGTQIFVEKKRPTADIDTVEAGNTTDTESTLQDVQNGQPAGTTLGQIEFVEDTMTNRIETSENGDAIDPIEIKEPVTIEMIKTTTIRATYETQAFQNELTEHTQRESEVLGTEDATMAVEITEKTTVKAKAICPYEGEEEPPFARNGVPSASNSTTGFEDLGTCSDADVDKIVDSIMNDIADIEADMEVETEEDEKEADMESNTQHQKLEICGKSIGIESSAICQDFIQSTGSHV